MMNSMKNSWSRFGGSVADRLIEYEPKKVPNAGSATIDNDRYLSLLQRNLRR